MSDGLPPLAEVVRLHGLQPKKSLGQNFLFDLNLTGRIARAAAPLSGKTVLEVGPGPGGLTRALLAEGADHVTAIDLDRRIAPVMEEISRAYPDRLTFFEADALSFCPPATGKPLWIVANLPYNIATALLTRWLESDPWPPWFEGMILMFQREVAERITAAPQTKSYGRLSVLCQWRSEPQILFDIHPSAFVPPPKVTSTVVRFDLRPSPETVNRPTLERVTAAAFNQRRKMLRQSLKALAPDPLSLLGTAGIDPTLRAEALEISDFVRLANAYDALSDPISRSSADRPSTTDGKSD